MANPKEKQGDREVFLDALRVMATMAVVMMHTISGVLNGGYDFTGYERRVKAFHALVDATSWSVPLFLMISGYLFLKPQKTITWKDAIFKYCRRIFLALLIFGVPFAFLEIFRYVGHFEWWMVPWTLGQVATGQGWAHMWYLYLILILYAVTPLIKMLLERIPAKATYAILIALVVGGSLLPFLQALLGAAKLIALPNQAIYVFYYLLGYVYSIRKKEPGRGEEIICLISFGVVIGLEMLLRFVPGYEIDMAYGYPLTLAAALLLFNAGWGLERRRVGRTLAKESKLGGAESETEAESTFGAESASRAKKEGWITRAILWLSPLCFGIYLIHPVFLNFFYKYMKLSIMNFRFYVGVPLFFLIAYVGALIGTWILRKIPVFRKYVL